MSVQVCRTKSRKSFHTLRDQLPRARSGSSGQVIWIAKFRPLFSKGRHGLTLQATMTTVLYGSVLGNRFGGSSIADSAIYPVVHGRGRETHVNEVDPIGSGLIKSINRPGANITGLSSQTAEIAGKRLQILKQLGVRNVAVILIPGAPFTTVALPELRKAAAASASISNCARWKPPTNC